MARGTVLPAGSDFVRFWLASTVSNLGSSLSTIAYPLLVLSMGGTAVQAGAVASASLITRTVCRLPGGHLADLIGRRVLMLSTDLGRLVVVASVPVAASVGVLTYPQLIGVAIVEGVATALFQPASTVLLRDLVDNERLTAAMSRTQAANATVLMVGPLAGGALFAIDRSLPFALDAASYGVSMLLLLTIVVRRAEHAAGGESDRRPTAGVRWLWRQPSLLRILLFAGVVNLVAAGIEVPLIVSLRAQGRPSSVIGLVIASAGVGAVVGALLATRILRWLPAAHRLYLVIGAVWIGGTALLAVVSSPWWMCLILIGLMALAPAGGIKLGQLTLARTPYHLVARVTTAQGTVTAGLSALGPGLAGVLTGGVGVPGTWLTMALMCLLATGITILPAAGRDMPAESEVLAHSRESGTDGRRSG